MKILFLIPELGYGGAETALLRLAQQLAQSHSVTIAVFRRAYQVAGYTNEHVPVTLPIVELDSSAPPPLRLFPMKLERWWHRVRELRRLKRQHDVTISFLSGANLLNALTPAEQPCVISERGSKHHDLCRPTLVRWLWLRLLDPLIYRLVDRIVCVSEGLSGEVRSILPLRLHHKVITISGYLDPELALAASEEPIESELLSLAERPLLIAAGRLHPQKGFQYLLPLVAQVAQHVARSGLLIIGDGPQQQQLLAQAKTLGLSVSVAPAGQPLDAGAQVIFLGYRPTPARYSRLGLAFVLSSLWEGLPNLLLESLAAGSWCLAADCPYGPAEVMTDPQLGILLPPIDDPAGQQLWLEAMVAAVQRPAHSALAPAVRRELVERFSIKASALNWGHLLNELVA
jgi:glycosyltransferase involved in cell wall biosynthesis